MPVSIYTAFVLGMHVAEQVACIDDKIAKTNRVFELLGAVCRGEETLLNPPSEFDADKPKAPQQVLDAHPELVALIESEAKALLASQYSAAIREQKIAACELLNLMSAR